MVLLCLSGHAAAGLFALSKYNYIKYFTLRGGATARM